MIEKYSRVNALQAKLLKGGTLPVKIPSGFGKILNQKYLAFELEITDNMDFESERENFKHAESCGTMPKYLPPASLANPRVVHPADPWDEENWLGVCIEVEV